MCCILNHFFLNWVVNMNSLQTQHVAFFLFIRTNWASQVLALVVETSKCCFLLHKYLQRRNKGNSSLSMCILLFVHYYYIKLEKKNTFPPLWLSLSDSFTENRQWYLLVNNRVFCKHAGSGNYIFISWIYTQGIVSVVHFSGFETQSDLSLSGLIHNVTLTSYPCMIQNSEGF